MQNLPEDVDQYMRLDKIRKGAEAAQKEKRPAMIEFLQANSSFPLASLSTFDKRELNMEVILEWARANLSPEIYDSLFITVPDPNRVAELMTQGIISKQALPPDYEKVSTQHRITVK